MISLNNRKTLFAGSAMIGLLPAAALTVVFCSVLVLTAWLSDDAFITLRTVDNLANGHGLRWNVAERVQSFTHPLWMFLLYAVYEFTGEPFYTTIAVSIVVSAAACFVLLRKIAFNVWHALAAGLLLVSSKAFIDYSTSGLENPLTHLVFVLFLACFLLQPLSLKKMLIMSFLSGLAVLNRMDTALLYFFPLLYTFFKLLCAEGCADRRIVAAKALGVAALGFLPFAAWELFSIFYYGFPFPNTAYAKLGTGLARAAKLEQGLKYLAVCFLADPVTILTVCLGVVLGIKSREGAKISVAGGLFLYAAYVLMIGGDFMAGRFYAAPFLGAVALIAAGSLKRTARPWLLAFAAAAVIFRLFLPAGVLPLFDGRNKTPSYVLKWGVSDERDVYYSNTGLVPRFGRKQPVNHKWAEQGRKAGKRAARDGRLVVTKEAVGFYGYYAGPDVHVVDYLGLCDPLLARLPANALYRGQWRPGHYDRDIPDGYLATLQTGQNSIENRQVSVFYRKISSITRGDLFSLPRCRLIWGLNTGQYSAPFYIAVPGDSFNRPRKKSGVPESTESRPGAPGHFVKSMTVRNVPAGDYKAVFRFRPGDSHEQATALITSGTRRLKRVDLARGNSEERKPADGNGRHAVYFALDAAADVSFSVACPAPEDFDLQGVEVVEK